MSKCKSYFRGFCESDGDIPDQWRDVREEFLSWLVEQPLYVDRNALKNKINELLPPPPAGKE